MLETRFLLVMRARPSNRDVPIPNSDISLIPVSTCIIVIILFILFIHSLNNYDII